MIDRQAPTQSLGDHFKDAMTLKQLATQNKHAEQTMAQEQQKRRMETIMPAMEQLASMPVEQRKAAFPQVQQQLIQSGALSPEQAMPEYDDGLFNQTWGMVQRSPQYMERQKAAAEIDKLKSDAEHNRALAKRGVARDPMQLYIDKKMFDEKQEQAKKAEELKTPYGVASTADDAKKIKDAGELKANFDRKLSEMIALREEYGGEALNRDAVGRGKQLSNDLLLLYKDLAKLGVMSQSDENILRSIIPSDPLEYRSPLAALQGQDPTMHRMKKFKEDAEADFQTRLANRVKPGTLNYAGPPTQKSADPASGGIGDGVNASHASEAVVHAPDKFTRVVNGVPFVKVKGGWQRAK